METFSNIFIEVRMGVGIKDVAKAAGVSPATVSRALGKGPVSEELRAQVEAAVRATGYRPNLAARRLRSQDSGTIGLVVADIRNPFFTAVSRAVEDSAYRAGMRVILCNTGEDPEREALYLRHMQSERITGLIFAPTRSTLDQLSKKALDFPVVFIDRCGPGGLHDAVVLDNREAMGELVAHLVERGYRRIGGLFGNSSSTGAQRRDGYLEAMARFGLKPEFRLVAPSAEAAQAEAQAWLAADERPEALVVSNSLLLIGVLRAARARGLAIPGDLALAGFDNESWTELVEPGITVIEQPVEEIGRAAMNLLFERLKTPGLPVRKVVLSGRCVLRGSTATRTP
ncbi:MAG: LacI family DNA-binding transcriptional regulator [Hydrocarboniphaga sp.]|uniref:Transcriptional regulator, LacI family n=2 Tax=Nevskiaceae TaxID=568386 RepID=I8T2Y7_9GAMM|nr:LacI family DNA-binding transcriptional regulator [Hydrocarboniphaga effusa]EIT68305.1 transcriptional regulator, LacI family [Hydrocarboniphaga effusa AP103]MDZ4078710.1 LacI family DNA-binding transcriptional regulator [Hydrocarboniphaga sp.]